MKDLIQWLNEFNRKERFFLVGTALGNPEFALSSEFKSNIECKLNISIPDNYFASMDYHLDWLFASLNLSFKDYKKPIFSNEQGLIKGTQEDIDFLIAYLNQQTNKYHLIMIEAKGVTSWNNEQMTHKALRLNDAFGLNGDDWPTVIPHFIFTSPSQPEKLHTDEFPIWMKPHGHLLWIKMEIADKIRVVRCNPQGNESRSGKYWTVKSS